MDQEEELEDMPWLEEKAMDLVEFSGTVTEAIPGPRVGGSKLPWILAVPLAYVGITFVLAFVRTVKKLRSPKAVKKRQVCYDFLCFVLINYVLLIESLRV